MFAALALAAALSGPLPPAYKGACPTSRARYVLRHDPKISLGVSRYPSMVAHRVSDVYIFVHSRHSGKTYWFELDWGSSSIRNVYPIKNPEIEPKNPNNQVEKAPPYDNMTILTLDEKLNFTLDEFEAATPAPKYILIPELQDAMWYGAEPREGVGTAFFILTGCARG
jgi:hypothetical protein